MKNKKIKGGKMFIDFPSPFPFPMLTIPISKL